MAIFEIEGPDGKTYEVDAPDMNSAVAAVSGMMSGPQRNADGTYGQPPAGFVENPRTGQMEDLASPNNPNIPQGRAAAATLGGMQGLSFDLADEAMGAIGGEYGREMTREADRRAQEQFPFSYNIPKVAGAVATSLAGARLAGGLLGGTSAGAAMGFGPNAATGISARVLQGTGLGATEGALFGFGQGDGIQDRLQGAATYGATGAALGAAAPFAVEGVRRGTDALIGGPIASMRSAPSEVRAGRAVQSALDRAGMTADDVAAATQAAAREGQPEFMAADALGRPGQRLLSSLARQPTDAQAEITEFLMNRQGTQGERLARIVSDALEAPQTAAAQRTALEKAKKQAADVAYASARQDAGPVNLNDAIAQIDMLVRRDPILGETALSQGPIGTRLNSLRDRLTSGNEQLIDFDTVLNIKSDLFDQIKKGRGGPEMSAVYNQLDQALEAASPSYRAANDSYREASRVIDMIDEGRNAARPSVREADVLAQYQGLTPEQQAAFRTGRADVTLAQIEAAAEGANKARPLTSGKAQSELPAMARDGDMLRRQIERENIMFETGRKTLGGSETAERIADDAMMDSQTMGIVQNLLRGNLGQAATQAGVGSLNVLQGRNTATREMIARALLSGDVSQAIAPALRADMMAGRQNAVAEALIRALPRTTN